MRSKRSFPLTHETIDAQVEQISAGTFALGFVIEGAFVPFLVGRSDCDIKRRLHDCVGVNGAFSHFGSAAKAAYSLHRRRSSPLGAPALAPVGIEVDSRYTHFEFAYADSAEAAFLTECERYHALGGSTRLDNARHPGPPRGGARACPAHLHRHG